MATYETDWIEIAAATLCVRGGAPEMINNKIRAAVFRARDFFAPQFDAEPSISAVDLARHIRTAAGLSRLAFRSGDVTTAAAHVLFILTLISVYGDDILLEEDEFVIVVVAPDLWTDLSAVLHSGRVSDVLKSSIYNAYDEMDVEQMVNGAR